MKQRDIILRLLSFRGDYVPSWELEKVSTEWGYIGTSGLKRCRELRAEGKIEQKDVGKFVYYRIKKEQMVLL